MDISFSWIFALIIGGFILFGAIYGVSKFSSMAELKTTSANAMSISAFLNPLETGVEVGKSTYITLPVESRVNNICKLNGEFGSQAISMSQYLKNSWTKTGVSITQRNKYIYSENQMQGRGLFAFSKELSMPFKVSNIIYLTSSDKKYCFINAPVKIKKELTDLNQENILFSECSNLKNTTKVCFSNSNLCDIVVNQGQKTVSTKQGATVYYEGDALMYAAIFSDKKLYECTTKRLMKRALALTKLYKEKQLYYINLGCSQDELARLTELESLFKSYNSSEDLSEIKTMTATLKSINRGGSCALW